MKGQAGKTKIVAVTGRMYNFSPSLLMYVSLQSRAFLRHLDSLLWNSIEIVAVFQGCSKLMIIVYQVFCTTLGNNNHEKPTNILCGVLRTVMTNTQYISKYKPKRMSHPSYSYFKTQEN